MTVRINSNKCQHCGGTEFDEKIYSRKDNDNDPIVAQCILCKTARDMGAIKHDVFHQTYHEAGKGPEVRDIEGDKK